MSLREHYLEGVFEGSIKDRKVLATKNTVPGESVYGEKLFSSDGVEYRPWDPYRSKLGAGIALKMKHLPQMKSKEILYLGAASGTTASHISDIVGKSGKIFCIEFSPRVVRKLVQLSEKRKNLLPLIADARIPSKYSSFIFGVDLIYQDIAQPDQAEILIRNIDAFLREKGQFLLALKSRSIDTTSSPEDVFSDQIGILEKHGLTIREVRSLEKFEKDHTLIVGEI